jgi:hypothetical protein
MKIEIKLTLLGALAILLLDSVASLLARQMRISYALFLPASIGVYFWVGYRAASYLNTRGAIAFGAFLGLVDATIGWKISNWLGKDTAAVPITMTFSRWCTTAFWVMTYGAVISLIAYLIATRPNKRKTS